MRERAVNGDLVPGLKRALDLLGARTELGTFLRFSLVGLSGTVVGLGGMWLFTEIVGLHYVLSGVITSFLSVTNNFIGNDLWTFNRQKSYRLAPLLLRWSKFGLSRAGSLALGMGVLVFFTDVLGLHYMVSTLLSIAVSVLLNYLTSRRWIWGQR